MRRTFRPLSRLSSLKLGLLLAALSPAFGIGCFGGQEEPQEPVEKEEADEAAEPAEPAEPDTEELEAPMELEAPSALPAPAAPPPPPPAAMDDPNKAYLWTHSEDVVVRDAPNESGKRVRTLGYGQKVEAVEVLDGWVKIGEGQFVRASTLTDRKARWDAKGKKGRPSAPSKSAPKAP